MFEEKTSEESNECYWIRRCHQKTSQNAI